MAIYIEEIGELSTEQKLDLAIHLSNTLTEKVFNYLIHRAERALINLNADSPNFETQFIKYQHEINTYHDLMAFGYELKTSDVVARQLALTSERN